MRSARGFAYAKVVIALVAVAVVVGIVQYVRSWVESYGKEKFEAGELKERGAWQKRESEELARANAAIAFLNERYRALEARHAADINALSGKHQEDLNDAKAQHERDLAAVRDGFRLRDPGGATACEGPGRSAPAEAVAAPSGSDGARGAELSERATAFLLAQANRADALVKKLHRVQDLVLTYYNACGAKRSPAARGTPPGPGGSALVEDLALLAVAPGLDHDHVPDLALELVMPALHHGDGVARLE